MRITKDDVTYTLSRIGVDALGIDGSDEYLLVKADDEVTIEQVQELVAELFYRDADKMNGRGDRIAEHPAWVGEVNALLSRIPS